MLELFNIINACVLSSLLDYKLLETKEEITLIIKISSWFARVMNILGTQYSYCGINSWLI